MLCLFYAWLFCEQKRSIGKYSYRSRVSFGDFEAIGQAKPEAEPTELVLQEQRPSGFLDYSVDGKHYNDSDLE